MPLTKLRSEADDAWFTRCLLYHLTKLLKNVCTIAKMFAYTAKSPRLLYAPNRPPTPEYTNIKMVPVANTNAYPCAPPFPQYSSEATMHSVPFI